MVKSPVLKDHTRKKSKLIPPLLAAMGEQYSPYSWATDAVPEVFWLAVFLREPFSPRDMDALVDFCSRLKLVIDDETITINRFSSFVQVPEDSVFKIIDETSERNLRILRRGFSPLNEIFDKHPLSFVFENDDTEYLPLGSRRLAEILGKLYDRHSKISTIVMATVAYLTATQGKLKISKHIEGPFSNIEAVFDYPDTDESKLVASGLRALAPMLILDNEAMKQRNSLAWREKFWRSVEGFGNCKLTHHIPFPELEAETESERVTLDYLRITRQQFLERRTALGFDLDNIEVSQVVGSLLARQTEIANDFIKSPGIWTPNIAPVLLRTMADIFITLSWILLDPNERAKMYIYDGVGRVKLEIAHRNEQLKQIENQEERDQQQNFTNALQSWVDSHIFDKLLEVNLGNWNGITSRKMAEEAGCLDFYNYVFQPFSAAVHSHWHHLSWQNSTYCENPAHNFHTVGTMMDREPEIYWLELATRYLRKTFSKFDEHFPNDYQAPCGYEFLMTAITEEAQTSTSEAT
ncbi:hypothetical protein GCM10016455_28040 [Aliiroseovarius zhejiangensis]|uniref:Uncharacterized protein n=1 Tax=Aliiroseovarius zhejiangensis TaxID=1632025 RepID=A0ABQ3J968_9RHOB|nr:DUF5677 domain-containing protein [Aliiroseovarius zhejiangensis]GHF05157.1 hypothetical protein GCM10016455_28040 [Aliiroseovarius zhejiangensis]